MIVRANGVDLWYDTFGAASRPAVLLIMGNSAQGILWPEDLCLALAADGYHVIRFDQRDTGLSTYVDFDAQPYDLFDLVTDAIGLLDALRVPAAHIVGLSQGGTLAYLMAGLHPTRVLTLTAIMASPDMTPKNDAFAGKSPRPGALPPPDPAFVAGVIAANAQAPAGDAEAVTQLVDNFRLAKGPVSPFDEDFWRVIMQRVVARPRSRSDGRVAKMANHGNHARAQAATPPLSAEDLGRVQAPALVIHGTHDPVFPPAHARWAAGAIPGARLHLVEKMGHALDPAFFNEISGTIVEHLRGAPGDF